MKKHAHLLLVSIISLILVGCNSEEISQEASFFRIYDHSNFDLSFDPIDFTEVADGFIILSGTDLDNSNFNGVQLVKVDETGTFERSIELTDYVIPVGDIHMNETDSLAYFFAMIPSTLSPVLIGVNDSLQVIFEQTIAGLEYPLASAKTSNNQLLLLSYDPLNLNSELSLINFDGSFASASARYSIGTGNDVETLIIDHYLGNSDRPLPFFCGEYDNGSYYFNGFYNFSISLVFNTLTNNPTGVLQGQSVNAGVRNILPLGGDNFAIAGYQFSENYQLPAVALAPNEIRSSVDLYPGDLSNLKSYTPSKIVSYESSGGTRYTIYAAETEGRQISLRIFDETTGDLVGIKSIGFINPFTLASMKVTSDNALVVLGTTFTAGRFERIMLNKISEGELLNLLQ